MVIKAKAIRTHHTTGIEKEVEITVEKIYHEYLKSWYVTIIKGGVTGYESFKLEDMNKDGVAWSACVGTKSRWDRLVVPAEEMKKIFKELNEGGVNLELVGWGGDSLSKFDYKSLTTKEMAPLFEEYNFKVIPKWHQYVSLTFMIREDIDRISYLHDVGTGKTIAALLTTLIWGCKKILVICPNSAFGAWERDIKKATDYSYTFVQGSKRQRFTNLKKKRDIYIIQYESLKTIHANLRKVGKENKRKWLVNSSSFVDNFDCIIFDEVHRCKSYDALQSEICFELTRRAEFCIGLTGTPFDETLLELFNIYKVIDLGKGLGTNFFGYRYKYFNRELRRGRKGVIYAEWVIKPGAEKQILDRLSSNTISFDRDECCDLPGEQTIFRPIIPSSEFLELQDSIINGDTIEVNGFEIDCSTIATKSQKLLQLSSGFLYYGDKDKERRVFHLQKNPKLDALIDLIQDTRSKVIVVHKFIEEALLIETAFRKNKIKFVAIRGDMKTDRTLEIQKFQEKSDVKIMLIHPTCASEGFDGSISNVMIFFAPIASPLIRKQCEGRIKREAQERKCVFIDLVLEQSADTVVNKNRAKRKGLIDSMMEYIQEYKSKK